MSDTQDTDIAQAPEPRFYGEDMVQEVIARLLTDGSLSEDQLVELQNRASLSLKPVDELALEEGLVGFAGYAVVVSHDRWFLDRIATHILAFEGDGQVYFFEGSYTEYEENRKARLGETEPKRFKYKKLMA